MQLVSPEFLTIKILFSILPLLVKYRVYCWKRVRRILVPWTCNYSLDSGAVVLKFGHASESPRGLVEHRWLGVPSASASVGLGWDLRCPLPISQVTLVLLVHEPHSENLCSRTFLSPYPYLCPCTYTQAIIHSSPAPIYWEIIDMHHCISLKCTAWWFDLHIL